MRRAQLVLVLGVAVSCVVRVCNALDSDASVPRHDTGADTSASNGPRQPVLIIGGLAGTQLFDRSDATGKRTIAWVRFADRADAFKEMLWCKVDPVKCRPGSGKACRSEQLAPDNQIEYEEGGAGLDGIRTLSPECRHIPRVAATEDLWYFDDMVHVLLHNGHLIGKDLFGFPYDWRQSNRDPATLQRLAQLLASIHHSTGQQVNVISHSMGGLVFKLLYALHPHVVEAHTARWITLGTPFAGSGGTVEAMMHGAQVGLINSELVHAMSMGALSMYEILPDPVFPWRPLPYVQYTTLGGSVHTTTWANYPTLLDRVNQGYRVDFRGKSVHMPFSHAAWSHAMETKRVLRSFAGTPTGPAFYSIHGVGLATPTSVRFQRRVRSLDDLLDPTAPAVRDSIDGDATVPVVSALADGLLHNVRARVAIRRYHQGLVKDHGAIALVMRWLQDPRSHGQAASLTSVTEAEISLVRDVLDGVEAQRVVHGTVALASVS